MRLAAALAGAVLAAAGCAHAPRAAGDGERSIADVFVGGEGGHAVYRIPAAVRLRDGRLLAFAEARGSQADIGRNALVMRASADGGRSWGAMREVAAIEGRSLNNPCAVEVTLGPRAGRTVLVFQSYPAGAQESKVAAGIDAPDTCHAHVTVSDDGGTTWSAPRDITRSVKRPPPVNTLASGPGTGIELRAGRHAGRLVVPFNQGPYGDWRVFMAVSDDGGDSWRMGETAPEDGAGHANEVQVAERADGSLLLAARQFGGGARRKTAVSTDGGLTWGALRAAPDLVDPSCMGGLVALDGGRRLVVTGPCDPAARRRGTAWVSDDGGSGWPMSVPVYDGSFAYSVPIDLGGGEVGVLFERDGCTRISFTAVRLPERR